MNTEINQNSGAGNWVAFLFGAVFNLIVSLDLTSHLDYGVRMLIAGLLWLFFKRFNDYLERRADRVTPKRFKKGKGNDRTNHQ
jgi:hypothetical protein